MSEPEILDERESLIHLRALIRVASETDDIEVVHKLLNEMKALVDKALPSRQK